MPDIPKDCTGWEFKSRPEYKFPPGLVLDRHCFSHETPDADIFPDGMKGVTFLHCNLDNVLIPPGNTVIGGSQNRFKVQNDLRDWYVDDKGAPVAVLNEKYWKQQNFSVDPKLIPSEKVEHILASHLDVLNGDMTVDELIAEKGII